MTTLDFVSHASTRENAIQHAAAVRAGLTIIQLHDELWRITRTDGAVLGYVERFLDHGDRRFRAKRMLSAQRASMPLGEFWRFDDAIDCFRFGS